MTAERIWRLAGRTSRLALNRQFAKMQRAARAKRGDPGALPRTTRTRAGCGNGLGGVTLHAHAPGENLTGNTITGNVIGTNNLDPDHDFGPPFDDGQTTGVVIISASSITITITHNVIFNNAIGIYLAQVPPAAITAIITANRFFRVAIHVKIVS